MNIISGFCATLLLLCQTVISNFDFEYEDFDPDICGGAAEERKSCAFVDSQGVRASFFIENPDGTGTIVSTDVTETTEIPATSVGVTLKGGIETESPVAQAIKNTADESSGGLYTTETMRPIDFGLLEAKAAAASARLALNAAENINSGRKIGVKQQEALQQEFAKGVKK